MYHQCERHQIHNKNATGAPSRYRDEVCQGSDCYSPHRPCHTYQATPSYRARLDESESGDIQHHGYGNSQSPIHREHVHCYLGSRICTQEADPRMNSIKTRIPTCTHHRKSCTYFRHATPRVHAQLEPQFHDWSEGENHIDHFNPYHVDKGRTPERQAGYFPKTHEHQPRQHAVPTAPGSFVCATMHKSHTNRCEGNIKCVRFSEENDLVQYPTAHDPTCPVHNSPSSDSRRHGSYGSVFPATSRASRTHKWVWGPPLPANRC